MVNFQVLFDILGVHDLLPHTALIELLGNKACPAPGIKELCAKVMFLIAGFDEKNLNLVQYICSFLQVFNCHVIDSHSSVCCSYSSRNISEECSPLGTG